MDQVDMDLVSSIEARLSAQCERIEKLEEVIKVYARHRANCVIHWRDACTCGWDAKQLELSEILKHE